MDKEHLERTFMGIFRGRFINAFNTLYSKDTIENLLHIELSGVGHCSWNAKGVHAVTIDCLKLYNINYQLISSIFFKKLKGLELSKKRFAHLFVLPVSKIAQTSKRITNVSLVECFYALSFTLTFCAKIFGGCREINGHNGWETWNVFAYHPMRVFAYHNFDRIILYLPLEYFKRR
jgi:hypothetical protein